LLFCGFASQKVFTKAQLKFCRLTQRYLAINIENIPPMESIKYDSLRMMAIASDAKHTMELDVESGFVSFTVSISISKEDFDVLKQNEERAALLCAAIHHPFQLRQTNLNQNEQKYYLKVILHAPIPEVEKFLTEKDHGSANGAISNFIRLTYGRKQSSMRQGKWFN
jgi:hypothetical protein